MLEKFYKYGFLILLGIQLFMLCSNLAYIERGYKAVGGEVFMLALPLGMSYVFDAVKHDKETFDEEDHK